jgi:hypothetical protein
MNLQMVTTSQFLLRQGIIVYVRDWTCIINRAASKITATLIKPWPFNLKAVGRLILAE